MQEITIARGLGIILVVMGHFYAPFSWYPVYSYHMPLFFILSGLVFNADHAERPASYIARRARRLLVPYFLYNMLFAGLTFACIRIFDIWQDIDPFSVSCLVAGPLTTGHQFPLFNAGWFLVTLFFVQAVFAVLAHLGGNVAPGRMLWATAAAALLAILAGKWFSLPAVLTQAGKVAFGLFFYACGHYARRWSRFDSLFTPRGLVVSVVAAALLASLGVRTDFNLSTMSFPGNPLLVFLTALNGAYLILYISKALAQNIKPTSIILTLGDATLPIMCLHLLFFFLLNMLLMPAYDVAPEHLANTLYKLDPEHLFPLYTAAGLLGPIALQRGMAAAPRAATNLFGRLFAKRSTP